MHDPFGGASDSSDDPFPTIGAGRLGVWEELERPPPDFAVLAGGTEVRRGSRVILRPGRSGDVFDTVLDGKSAIVESIEQDMEENVSLTVTLDADPGRDLGERRIPGHRFFFSPDEVEPLEEPGAAVGAGAAGAAVDAAPARRVLVAGIGNVFLGDDGFGVELAARLARQKVPAGVDVVDFGVRGMDLAYALADYDVAVLLDALPRGEAPGTLYVLEAELEDAEPSLDAHGMDPVTVLRLARTLGSMPDRVLVVGCEPANQLSVEEDDLLMELSEPMRAALHEAVRLVEDLLDDVTAAGGAPSAEKTDDDVEPRERGSWQRD